MQKQAMEKDGEKSAGGKKTQTDQRDSRYVLNFLCDTNDEMPSTRRRNHGMGEVGVCVQHAGVLLATRYAMKRIQPLAIFPFFSSSRHLYGRN